MTKPGLTILLFLLPCALLPGQNASCGYRWLSEQQDSATSLRVAYASRLLDRVARNEMAEHRAEITIPVVIHIVWQKPDENISDESIKKEAAAATATSRFTPKTPGSTEMAG